ncbi:MAG TPA: hypothetical protein VHO24_21160 [Opitutaceae bacterium]|nr:hypothetical protein [Opitutaceae bacterium]
MKLRALLLVGSLLANITLAFLVANRSAQWIDFSSDSRTTAAQPTPSPGSANESAAALATPPLSPADGANPQTWAQLNTGDLPAAVARLRAAGLPPALLRAMVRTLVSEQFEDRRKVLTDAIKAQPWWLGESFNFDPKIGTIRRRINRDQEDLVNQLLGPDTDLTEAQRARQRRAFGDLPQDKIEALQRIDSDYAQMMAEVRMEAQGMMLAEDRAKLALLEQEKSSDMAALLSPEERFEHDLRSSPSSAELRGRLAAFDATEAEFRLLFKLQKTVDDQFGPPQTLSVEQRNQRNQALAKLLPQVEAALGAARFAEFKETTDGNYLTTSNLVRRFELPPTATREIIAIQRDINQRSESIRGDRNLAPETRNAQLMALGQEANTRLAPILGPDALSAYKQGGGGWINNLVRPPAPAGKK